MEIEASREDQKHHNPTERQCARALYEPHMAAVRSMPDSEAVTEGTQSSGRAAAA